MNADNTKDKAEFVIDHIWWASIIYLWYKPLLFRCFGACSLKESRLILFGIVSLCSLFGILLQMEKQRNGVSVLMNLLAGYGLYTLLTYFSVKRHLFHVSFVSIMALAAAYSTIILSHRISDRGKTKRILFRRFARIGRGIRNLVCSGLAVIMVIIGSNSVFGTAVVTPAVTPVNQSVASEQTIANNLDTLVLLREETWTSLSVDEKLSVLQTVANIEQHYLGLPHELNVGASNLRKGLEGYYDDSKHQIVVNMDNLIKGSSYEAVETIAHEAYHSLQRRMVDAFDEASEDMKQLIFFYTASVYKEEFAEYIDGEENYFGYYMMKCESDARQYSEIATEEYLARVEEYINNSSQRE